MPKQSRVNNKLDLRIQEGKARSWRLKIIIENYTRRTVATITAIKFKFKVISIVLAVTTTKTNSLKWPAKRIPIGVSKFVKEKFHKINNSNSHSN